jgi:hypothetical protein
MSTAMRALEVGSLSQTEVGSSPAQPAAVIHVTVPRAPSSIGPW